MSTTETRANTRSAIQIAQRLGISVERLYQLWDAAAREIGIPQPRCLRDEDADALESFARNKSPKARRKLQNL